MNKASSSKQQEVQRIVETISDAIAQHRLKPGTRLIEAQIVEVLAANRNHVQSALQRLAMQHIVTIEPHRGAMVAKPEAREAREVFTARRAVETAIIAGITPAQMQRYQPELNAQRQAEKEAIASNNRLDIVRQLSQFHLLLAEISDNRVLSEILTNLTVRSSLIVALYQRNEDPASHSGQHSLIVTALQAGDNRRAQQLMDHHMHELEQELSLDDVEETPSLRDALA
ncbi:MAG TPA: GntR family transcriptional regulator [Erwinia sp.]|uniref:GntR family transcriptional regulator n=1 Tax=Erwinia citreus TaxID=558 RepID=UPI000E8D895E|nr:GntR family transcriptional regulator [Erwinia sp.]HBV39084.1 GntR family transcriptional regulator [Erwinia sp.]